MHNYQVQRVLGRGAAGEVVLAKDKRTGDLVAIKEIFSTVERPEITAETVREVELMKALSHPNVVGFRDSFHDGGHFRIVMEYADAGDLAQFIKDRNNRLLSEEQIWKLFVQIVLGLKYLHDRKIVHRDLKPQNIYMTRVGVVKIGDFGVSKLMAASDDLCKTQIGTPYYLAPEIWNSEPYGSSADMWSVGCILYELCALKRPFIGQNVNHLLVNVIQGKYNPLSTRYTSDLRDVVKNTLCREAKDRLSANDILGKQIIASILASMIRENESRLKTVNVITTKRTVTRKKTRKGKRIEPEVIDRETELPLPDEDLPKWAQRVLDGNVAGDNSGDTGTLTIQNQEEEEDVFDEERNEWVELGEATAVLQQSLTMSQGLTLPKIDMDDDEIQDEVNRLTEQAMKSLGEPLFNLLYENMETEEVSSSREFIDIMESEDPEIVDIVRRICTLQKLLL